MAGAAWRTRASALLALLILCTASAPVSLRLRLGACVVALPTTGIPTGTPLFTVHMPSLSTDLPAGPFFAQPCFQPGFLRRGLFSTPTSTSGRLVRLLAGPPARTRPSPPPSPPPHPTTRSLASPPRGFPRLPSP